MSFVSIIKGDYLQRTRSYGFLVTLAISLFVAYTFVPATDASYTTLRIGNYIGEYNSAWIGYVSAIMTSVFLSLIGFYLVNSGIKKDIETEVGMIIATTQVSNFKYLLSKAISNYLVLLTIVVIVFLVNIGIFFIRSEGFPFEIL
jgi:putative Mn2+ efflux pump MntP